MVLAKNAAPLLWVNILLWRNGGFDHFTGDFVGQAMQYMNDLKSERGKVTCETLEEESTPDGVSTQSPI